MYMYICKISQQFIQRLKIYSIGDVVYKLTRFTRFVTALSENKSAWTYGPLRALFVSITGRLKKHAFERERHLWPIIPSTNFLRHLFSLVPFSSPINPWFRSCKDEERLLTRTRARRRCDRESLNHLSACRLANHLIEYFDLTHFSLWKWADGTDDARPHVSSINM